VIAARLAAYYGVMFFLIGVMVPFWPVWMKSRGLTPEDIGVVMAIGMLMKVWANPLVASYADRSGERRRPLIILSLTACVAFALFWYATDFWPILAVTMVFFLCWSPTMPLIETLTMQLASGGRMDYGRIRLWGSLTFIVAAWGGGWVLTGRDEDIIYWIILGSAIAVVISAICLPDAQLAKSEAGRSWVPFLTVLKDRTFLWFILATGLIQTSHVIYYAFGTIHWQNVGHSEAVIGWLWAEGIIIEVILFSQGNKVIARIGPARLIAIAGLAGLIRWAGTGLTDALPALLVLQVLHGITFGAAHLGAIHFIAQRMDASISATAQSVYAAAVSGIGFSLVSLFSGHMFAQWAGGAYLPMAAMAGLGGIIAFQLRRR